MAGGALRELLTATRRSSALAVWGRAAALAFFSLWGLKLSAQPIEAASQSFMHYVNLPMHEAGHIIFSPLGSFMQVLGGTLMQLLMPLVALAALLLQNRDAFGASLAGWWLGENFIDAAPYIGDARAGQLLLLGGVTGRQAPGFHDWSNILGGLGWLEYDRILAYASFWLGAALMLASTAWGGYVLYLHFRELRECP